jgi:hypothetical protein
MNPSSNLKKTLYGLVALVVVAGLAFVGIRYPQRQTSPQPEPSDVEALGVSHFSGMQVQGSETDELVVDQTSTGDIVELRDNGTVVWRLSDGGNIYHNGELDINGQKLDLDADADTSIEADTDDQVDWELGGADVFVMKDFGTGTVTTAATEHLFEILDTTRVISTASGTSTQTALNIDLGIGNSTAGTSIVNGILIDGISQDAQNTETGIVIANGWDRGIDLDGNSLYMDNDQDSYFSELADDSIGFTPGAATGSLEIRTGNLQVGDGNPDETHNGEDFYVEGISEFDGTAYFDGSVDFDNGLVAAEDVENMFLPTLVSTAITYTASAGGSGTVITITDGEIWLIHDVFVNVTTDFDCTGDDATLVIGDGNDADGFCVLADAELQTSDTEGTGWAAGWQCQVAATVGVYTDENGGFIYAPSGADETIDYLIDEGSGESLTAGAATIYVWYTRLQ